MTPFCNTNGQKNAYKQHQKVFIEKGYINKKQDNSVETKTQTQKKIQ